MEERVGKLFQITEEKSGRTCMIGFEQYKSFEQRCKHKFDYPDNLNVLFETEDGNVEIDESAFMFYPNNTKFRMRPVLDDSEKQGSKIIQDSGALSGNPRIKPSGKLPKSKDGTTATIQAAVLDEDLEADLDSGSAKYKDRTTGDKHTGASYENIDADRYSGSAAYKKRTAAAKHTDVPYENIDEDPYRGSDAVDESPTFSIKYRPSLHGKVDRFSVIVEESPLANKCNIVGRMTMLIGSVEIGFEHSHTGRLNYIFLLGWIRGFVTLGGGMLKFKLGRKCPNGEGDVIITSRDAKDIERLLQRKMSPEGDKMG